MAVIDVFSKRQRRARGEIPDVYTYNELPQELRAQITHIIVDAFGHDSSSPYDPEFAAKAYYAIHKALCKEYGTFALIRNETTDKKTLSFATSIKSNQSKRLLTLSSCASGTWVASLQPVGTTEPQRTQPSPPKKHLRN